MKNRLKITLFFWLIVICATVAAQDTTIEPKKKVLSGFSGGMMLHTGYLDGTMPGPDYRAKGAPFGIGGKICVHLGEHWMVGSEGYVSTLRQMRNGSYVKYGWGGVLGEFYWAFNRVKPFIGLTIGGGAQTSFLMFEGDSDDWHKEDNAVFHKQGFCAITPFIGCDFSITKVVHVTIKADWINAITREGLLTPTGPRFYVGFLFYH